MALPERLVAPLVLTLAACAAPPTTTSTASSGTAVPPAPGIVVAAPGAPEPPPGMRLPDTLKPVAQSVELTIVPSSEVFEGTSELEVELASATETLWLNARALTVDRASLGQGGAELAARISVAPERVGLRFPRVVGPGRATLHLAFHGTISGTEDAGIFHQREGGDWYAMTQFEESDARRAFPCVDEPSAKIPWELTLRVPRELVAVANTPIASEEPVGSAMKRVRFARTRPLPSYLIAFGVGPYDSVEARPAGVNKVPMRVYTPRGRTAEAAYAVRSSPEILEALEAYLGVPYPYEKLDLLTIPLTVHFGAMENAGLVTVASNRLLVRPGEESVKFRRYWAAYAAHEFAHQWFGDLVTLAWWNDIWLNESFASWMENKALDAWAPTWGIPVEDVIERDLAATADTLITARSIRQPIQSYDDITNAFDRITYQKGASVLRMFEAYLGVEPFRKGIQLYLRRHANGNATAQDFLAAISEAVGHDVAPAFGSFLDQPGVPEVTALLSCPAGKPAQLALGQRRLLSLGTTGREDTRWQLPVCARWSSSGRDARACTLITGAEATLVLDGPGCPPWVLPNAGYAGYYRLKLTADALRNLVSRGRASLSAAETVGLLGDVEALIATGRFPQATGLEVAARFADARRREVVEVALDLARVRADFLDGSTATAYPPWVRRHFGARARALGMESRPGDDEETRLLRPMLVGFVALRGEDPKLIEAARAVARRWLEKPDSVDPDMVESALTIAARFGDAAFHQTLLERLKTSPDRAIRAKLVLGLAAFQDPALVRANMALFEGAAVDRRELIPLLLTWPPDAWRRKMVPASSREIVFRAVSEHFEAFSSGLPERSAAYLFHTGEYFCDSAHRQAVEAAFGTRAHTALGGPRTLAQVLETVDLCIAARAVQVPSIAGYLAAKGH